ncbi:hypothetical protein NSND_62965 [Nitrospira sp. ND1]|nr:hypothetical protein NSND_62965 [Nitrospira sp. ND1]
MKKVGMMPSGFHLRASRRAKTRCTYQYLATSKNIPPGGTTKEVLHSGLSEMTIRFYAYT